jgi:3-oxoacyl-[acyl-carrier-protein] synthase-3
VTPAALEQAAGHCFGTVAELAVSLAHAGVGPVSPPSRSPSVQAPATPEACAWLSAVTCHLPDTVQLADELNAMLGRPSGWLQARAGIEGRRLWGGADALSATAAMAADCLRRVAVPPSSVGALLVTAEAPPLAPGLAAELHRRLGLPVSAVALEVGGACVGFLAALWTGLRLLPAQGLALIVAVEAPSSWMTPVPGAAGETAALFGDGAAACVLAPRPTGPEALPLREVSWGVDACAGPLLHVDRCASGGLELRMDGPALASWAVRTMSRAVTEMADRQKLSLSDLAAVVAHGGNGRLPGLLARRLGLPAERVQSEASRAGNLGAASLPVAWATRPARGPVAWVAVGAGGVWGAALTG